jgi:hypothetical protein
MKFYDLIYNLNHLIIFEIKDLKAMSELNLKHDEIKVKIDSEGNVEPPYEIPRSGVGYVLKGTIKRAYEDGSPAEQEPNIYSDYTAQ